LAHSGRLPQKPFSAVGFPVAGWTRTRRVELRNVQCFVGQDERANLLRQSDILVCMLPLTPDTRGIINSELLSALPDGAAVINVGRGGHVVEEDLLSALNQNLSGATLDVFNQEPLSSDHPFWRHPKIFITPHVATIVNPDTAAPQVAENLRRLRAGKPLLNLVDEKRGY
jgi:glyoxylate/hydroxypyruvate reductase A